MSSDPIAAVVETLYLEYGERMRKRILRQTSDAQLAEDLCQGTFCQLLAALRGGTDVRHRRGFLYRIAHNLIIDYYRHRDRMRVLSIDGMEERRVDRWIYERNDEWVSYGEGGSHIVDPGDLEAETNKRLDLARMLGRFERAMTERQVAVIQLRYFDGYAFDEIAAALDMTEGAVKALRHRAVETLRTRCVGLREP